MFQLNSKELNLISEAITMDIVYAEIGRKWCSACNDQCKKGMK